MAAPPGDGSGQPSDPARRAAFDLSPVPTAILSLPDLQVVEVNAAFATLLGRRRPTDLVGEPASALVDPVDVVVPRARRAPSVGRSRRVRLRPAGGTVLVVDATMSRVGVDEPFLVLHVLPERVGTGALYDLGQELSNPLTSVVGSLELLADGELGPLTADQARMVAAASRNAARLAAMTENLLSLDPEGVSRAHGRTADVDAVVQETVRRAEEADRGRHVVEVRPLGRRVLVDLPEDRLARVLTELLENAVTYTPAGGHVLVTTVEPNGDARGVVEVSVTDTGVGIPRAEHELVFERFTRASTGTMLRPNAAGLGLAAVRRCVEGFGGEVYLDSAVGVGSRFLLRLPRSGPAAAPDQG
ncbi:sensor histidine kinase [Nocardioides donggukensis]|uniref:Sensor-like histidine kinase SenX3 n=1 Tax=Nocardioides donggukensis TaxID=2774019 RepID=A0A927Q2A1_9ACTN|nr:PAS domain-containing sensor histidine kinase [Nocardioides donggukensis]MBD8869476.1 PAS domain-containing sensor histidine kinase [Nocardioides donggukensis]